MLHTVMIALHAAGGVAAFVAGCLALFPPRDGRRARRLFGAYLGSLGLMLVFLLAAIAADWQQLSTAPRVVFGGLLVLALFMGWRALAARGLLRRRSGQWQVPYIGHVGFTLIALWDGFVVVSAIDLGAPGWLVGVLALLGVVVGNRALHRVKARAQPSDELVIGSAPPAGNPTRGGRARNLLAGPVRRRRTVAPARRTMR